MAGQGDEREKRRREGIESEREDASPDSTRLIVGYSVAAVVVLAVAGVLVVLASGRDSRAPGGSGPLQLHASRRSAHPRRPRHKARGPPAPRTGSQPSS